MKTTLDALGTAENESGIAKPENGTRRPRFRRKLVRERKTRKSDSTPSVPLKMGPEAQNVKKRADALGTPKNMFGSEKHENDTRRPRYRRKRVRERKT
jgi:hypothetical protein